ncbi:MAG TPA: hypothetical protein VGQ08_15765 [Nitrospiraceae bacterium]|jgi:hypothetical protein|nr:hypothetical protein [Nitrospiraceae bacterium]
MSLRKSGGEDWEQAPKPENMMSDIKKAHLLMQYGRSYGCVCGKVFDFARSRRDGEMQLGVHHTAVKEMLEDRQQGKSYLDE